MDKSTLLALGLNTLLDLCGALLRSKEFDALPAEEQEPYLAKARALSEASVREAGAAWDAAGKSPAAQA